MAQVGPQRAQPAEDVDARMVLEALVLAGDQGEPERARDVVHVEQDPLLRGKAGRLRSVPGQDASHLGRRVVLEAAQVGHVFADEVARGGAEHRGQDDQCRQDAEAVAEPETPGGPGRGGLGAGR